MAPAERHRSTGTLRIVLRPASPAASPEPNPSRLAVSGPDRAEAAPITTSPSQRHTIEPGRVAHDLAFADFPNANAAAVAAEKLVPDHSAIDEASLSAASRTSAMSDLESSDGSRLTAVRPVLTPMTGATSLDPNPASGIDAERTVALDSPAKIRRGRGMVALEVTARVNGASVGRVSLLIRDRENISIRLADLLTVLEPAMEPSLFERLSASRASQTHLTLNDLRLAGISVQFDERDRLLFATH